MLLILWVSRSLGSRVVSRTVHVIFGLCFELNLYGFWTEAEAPSGEVDESSCFSWSRAAGSGRLGEGNGAICKNLLPLTDNNILRGTISVALVRESVLCILFLKDRLCEMEEGGIKKRDEWGGVGLRRTMVVLREARPRTCRIRRGC